MPAKTLYDLLHVRPDDDAETLKSAFHSAVKASHPDLNASDPDALRRFRQVVTAYAILRDAEQRGVYDRLLALEHAQSRSKLRRTIVSHAAAVVALTVVLVGGFTLFARISKTPVETVKKVEVAARGPADITAVQPMIRTETASRDEPSERLLEAPETATVPSAVTSGVNSGGSPAIAIGRPAEVIVVEPAAPTDKSDRSKSRDKPARVEHAEVPSAVAPGAKSKEPLIIANGGLPPDPIGSDSKTAKTVDALDARVNRGDARNGVDDSQKNTSIDHVDAKVTADDHKKNDEYNPLNQNGVRSVETQLSSLEKDISVAKSRPSNLTIFDEKHDMRTTGKLRVHATLPATNHTSVRQAALASRYTSQVALESRNISACSGSCSDRVPLLFGLGF